MALIRDVNTKIVIYVRGTLPSTQSDVTWLTIQHGKTRTENDATKRFLALIAASAAS
jgi:hypothetical protein